MKKITCLLLFNLVVFTANAQHSKVVRGWNNPSVYSLQKAVQEDYTFDWEPIQAETFNFRYTYLNTIYFDDGYGDGSCDLFDIYLDGDSFVTNIFIIFPLDSIAELPLGTYEFKPNWQPVTGLSSNGGNEEYDNPSYIGMDIADPDEGTYYTSYFITGGTITVSELNGETVMDIRARTYNGSVFYINSTGNIPTSIEDIHKEPTVKVWCNSGELHIEGAEQGADIEIYTTTGQLLHKTQANNNTTISNLPASQVLLVKCGSEVQKVIL